MKNVLLAIAIGFVGVSFTGCGSDEPALVEPSTESTLSTEQQQSYEESMKQGGSSRKSAPK